MLKQLTYKGTQQLKPLSSLYWATQCMQQRLEASILMTEWAYQQPKWWEKPMQKQVFTIKKRQ